MLADSTVAEGEAGAFFNRFELLRDPSHVRSLTLVEWQRLIGEAGLTLQVAETFFKRHDFDDWTARSRMSAEDKATLQRMMLDAEPSVREEHRAEFDGERLLGFQDTKTLFLAIKS